MERRRFYDWLSRYYWFVGLFDNYYKRAALRMLDMRRGERFLDAGCGDGFVLRYLREKGCLSFLCGVDRSIKMVKRAKCRSPNRVFLGDCFFLPFKDGSFDVLFSSFVFDLFSFPEQKRIAREFSRVLCPGGKLVLVNNTRGSGVFYILSGFYVILRMWFPKVLLNRPVDGCHAVLDRGGFRVRSTRVMGFTEILVFEKGN